LLEVGTGFHNELSGRENIYLNGAILGMKRVEIKKKFDEIVEFSEIAKFLDTPVKHYSSGMYMRLAFAIAAHLEPEILIVDEVLAVGDVGFQKKCLNKMREVGRLGRTVIFVSHDMQAIARLCNRVIWMKGGEIVDDGPAKTVISAYLHEQSKTGSERVWDETEEAPGNGSVRLRRVRVVNAKSERISTSEISDVVGVEMTYEVLDQEKVFVPSFQFHNEQGVCILISHDWSTEWRERRRPKGVYTSTVWVPENFLAEGSVFVTAGLAGHRPAETHVAERDVVTFNVVDSPNGGAARGDYVGIMPGVVRPFLEWRTETEIDES
jgi:lipopolysaccharide transport system ATP-binding protein